MIALSRYRPVRFIALLAAVVFVRLAVAAPANMPALVVVIAIDQFRGDYPARFQDYFGDGGFKLLEQGAVYTDCHYLHSITKTACGHATILTGVHADVHGIIANDWIDRTSFERINSVDDRSVQLLGVAPARAGARMPSVKGPVPSSPRALLATTVIDEFKLSRGGRPKVISISNKDRSAVLLGGKTANAAYWMDEGRMISSTYYHAALPDWVTAFNAEGRAEAYFGRTWDRVLPAAEYDKVQGPDDAPGESNEFGMGRTFPKRIDGGAKTITPAFYAAFENTPFKSEVLAAFVRRAVEAEDLGRRGVTDVLCVSFSANDSVGHSYGPDSHEVMDMTIRTDRLLAELFSFLDQRVGLKNCVIVLTADHGIAPLPERTKQLSPGIFAGRVDNVRVQKTCDAAMDRAFGPLGNGRHWIVTDSNWLLFVQGVLGEKHVAVADAERVVRDALLTIDFVELAYTRSELMAGNVSGQYGEAARLSFNRERSGDVFYQVKPYWVDRATGANHGTPYNYDTYVPLLWYGMGVPAGVHTERVHVEDIAPTLAHLLHIPAPPMAHGRMLF